MRLYREASDGLVAGIDDPHDVIARIADGNPLADGWTPPDGETDDAVPLVAWSGTLADDLYASDPRTWMAAGRAALDRWWSEIGAAGRPVHLRPHCRHVLSDVPSCRRFIHDHAEAPPTLALAPADLLEPVMLDAVEDHLGRILELLVPCAAVVLLHDVEPTADGDRLVPVPLGAGRLACDDVRDLLKRHVPAELPVVLRADGIDGQMAWLTG
jgi:hypothetical protein